MNEEVEKKMKQLLEIEASVLNECQKLDELESRIKHVNVQLINGIKEFKGQE